MATINVYVPDHLKQDMDALDPAPNWSGLCQAAIKQEITRLRAIAGEKSAIIARVRATGSKQFQMGYDDGKTFAAETADLDDFEVFAEQYDELAQQRGPVEAIQEIARVLGTDSDYFFGDTTPTLRYADGFAKAVKETWGTIRNELRDV